MMKHLLTLVVSAALGQTPLLGFAFQHPGGSAAPSSRTVEPQRSQQTSRRENSPEGQSGPVLGKPFMATEVRHTMHVLGDGTRVKNSDTSLFYRDDRGRMRIESPTRILIYDPVSGFTYDLNPKAKSYYKTQISDRSTHLSMAIVGDRTYTLYSDRPARGEVADSNEQINNRDQSVTEDLPPQVIDSVHVKGSRITLTIPAGTFGNDRDVKVVNERWYSDDLKVLVKSSNSDPRFGVTTYELTNIVQASPDPALFQAPADYVLKIHKLH